MNQDDRLAVALLAVRERGPIDEHGRQNEKADTYRSWAHYLRKAGRESEALDVLDRAAQLSSSPQVKV